MKKNIPAPADNVLSLFGYSKANFGPKNITPEQIETILALQAQATYRLEVLGIVSGKKEASAATSPTARAWLDQRAALLVGVRAGDPDAFDIAVRSFHNRPVVMTWVQFNSGLRDSLRDNDVRALIKWLAWTPAVDEIDAILYPEDYLLHHPLRLPVVAPVLFRRSA